jgi:hypothetical protein
MVFKKLFRWLRDRKTVINYRVDGWDEAPVNFSVDGEPRFPIEHLDARFRRMEGKYGDPTL